MKQELIVRKFKTRPDRIKERYVLENGLLNSDNIVKNIPWSYVHDSNLRKSLGMKGCTVLFAEDKNAFNHSNYSKMKRISTSDYHNYVKCYKYKSILDLLERNREYNHVTVGMNSFERSIILVDRDYPYSFDDIDHIKFLCKRLSEVMGVKFPEPNFITINRLKKNNKKLDNNHYQIGWVLSPEDSYIIDGWKTVSYYRNMKLANKAFENYSNLIYNMARLFGGDVNYKGFNCKNPFYKTQETIWISNNYADRKILESLDDFINRDDFISNMNISYDMFPVVDSKTSSIWANGKPVEKTYRQANLLTEMKKIEKVEKKYSEYLKNEEAKNSRHMYATNEFRTLYFKMLRNGEVLELNDAIELFKQFERDSLKFNGKLDIESDAEIRSAVISTMKFCEANFDPSKASRFSDKDRKASADFRNARKSLCHLVMFLKRREGFNHKEIREFVLANGYGNCNDHRVVYRVLNHETLDENYKALLNFLRNYKYCFKPNVRFLYGQAIYVLNEYNMLPKSKNMPISYFIEEAKLKVMAIISNDPTFNYQTIDNQYNDLDNIETDYG